LKHTHYVLQKRQIFKKFATIVQLVDEKKHLEINGLVQILKIIQTMNHKKSHQSLIRILTHHT